MATPTIGLRLNPKSVELIDQMSATREGSRATVIEEAVAYHSRALGEAARRLASRVVGNDSWAYLAEVLNGSRLIEDPAEARSWGKHIALLVEEGVERGCHEKWFKNTKQTDAVGRANLLADVVRGLDMYEGLALLDAVRWLWSLPEVESAGVDVDNDPWWDPDWRKAYERKKAGQPAGKGKGRK